MASSPWTETHGDTVATYKLASVLNGIYEEREPKIHRTDFESPTSKVDRNGAKQP